jgi:phenylalanyl-tRNA synthetase alpha chain
MARPDTEARPSPEGLLEALGEAERSAQAALKAAVDGMDPSAEVEAVRLRFLGKKGEVSRILKSMGALSSEDRPKVGQAANAVRDAIEAALEDASAQARRAALRRELEGPPLDVTLPGRPVSIGRRHPVSRTWDEVTAVFREMGFEVAAGPEIEGDFYNFEALNIPPEHPARDMQDTFYLEGGRPKRARRGDGTDGPEPGEVLLRTHTSPVQVRAMLGHPPPVRVVCPGKVYRRDSDVTHTPMFHQIEGLWVDRGVTMADLKGTLQLFAKRFFGSGTKVRLRPSYFQFTEPSAEVDVSCSLCGGSGCKTCSGTGWLEILGAGMVDPAVFEAVGYDPEIWTGFAFGMGIDRVAMLKYRVDDLRMLFENDARFLDQFP